MPRYWSSLALLAATPLFAYAASVDFATEVHPILAAHCMPCHSGKTPQAGLLLTNGDGAKKAIVPGKPEASLLLTRILGEGGKPVMPPTGSPLKPAEVAKIRQWITEGAVWPEMSAKSPASTWEAPIAPRKVALPAGSGHPVDLLLDQYWKRNNVTPAAPIADAQFARRAYFDVWGIPPSPQDLDAFVQSQDPDKRAKLIRTLLANNTRYADHWISFWNDMLRNDIGVAYHGERKSITSWLENALDTNKPYRQMVRELLDPGKEGPDGFLIGVNWRGDINASQTPFMQASQNTAQVFLGINLKCASCHDSFINKYRLAQAYGLAAFFSEANELELVRCDMKTGKIQKPEFLYPELAKGIDIGTTTESRRKAAAALFTHPQNGRVSRTLVNRYWQKLVGKGIVEPVDEMDNEPWNADLLDWLAVDFDEHNQDIKHLIERIMTSRAYQMPTVAPGNKIFEGPTPRRVSAEEFIDTASAVTGEWRTAASGDRAAYVRDWKLKSSPLTRALGRPIRDQVYTTRDDAPTTFQALELANGQTLTKLIHRGARRLLGQLAPPPENLYDSRPLRRGYLPFDTKLNGAQKLWLVIEDAGTYDPAKSRFGWADVEFVTKDGTVKPYNSPTKPEPMLSGGAPLADGAMRLYFNKTVEITVPPGVDRIRGRFVIDDDSTPSDIIATPRFFLFGEKPDMDQLIRVAGNAPLARPQSFEGKSAAEVTRYLFRAVLSRNPSEAEQKIAVGNAQRFDAPAVEDLLWSLLMHPEFQYLP
ncbi:hypothetical protein F183_A30220 [Bryobacterales bacterium F-183]|nr:hypothetical protein F183_A30220 [Bryobacterales bacterium F-183]